VPKPQRKVIRKKILKKKIIKGGKKYQKKIIRRIRRYRKIIRKTKKVTKRIIIIRRKIIRYRKRIIIIKKFRKTPKYKKARKAIKKVVKKRTIKRVPKKNCRWMEMRILQLKAKKAKTTSDKKKKQIDEKILRLELTSRGGYKYISKLEEKYYRGSKKDKTPALKAKFTRAR